MKKIISRPAVAGSLFILIYACLMGLSLPAYSADTVIARLTSFSGTVMIKSQGEWGVPPEEGMPLYSEDKIVTRAGIATITFDDGAVMNIKANSNLLIKETRDTTGISGGIGAVKRQLRLLVGKMMFRSGKGSTTGTTLETTTMVCGLRGTAGTLSIDAAGVTYLNFTEGGGDTIGNFIAGIAADVPSEIADLNTAQRAAFVAAAAADLANRVSERLASGETTDAEVALAAANAARAAALEARAAAEAMLNNPDEDIRREARAAIAAAEKALKAAEEAQQAAIAAGATGDVLTTLEDIGEIFGFDDMAWNFMNGGDDDRVLGDAYGVLGDYLTRMVYNPAPQGNEDRILQENDGEAPLIEMTDSPEAFDSSSSPNFSFTASEYVTCYYILDQGEKVRVGTSSSGEVSFELEGLSEGAHTLELIVQDAYGNETTMTFTWVTDTTAPVITLLAEPGDTATLKASSTNDEPGEVTYSFIDTDTGDNIDPSDVSPGTYGIIVTAVDQAGNVSYAPFILYVNSLDGQASGSGNTFTGSAAGTVAAVYEVGTEAGTGGWGIDLSGQWTDGPISTLSLASGGSSGDNEGYWLSLTSGSVTGSGSATGTSNFYLINGTSISIGTGTFSGTFSDDYTWSGTDTGSNLVTTPFVIGGGAFSESLTYYYTYTAINTMDDGSALAYAGLTATDTSDYDYFAMGSYWDYLTYDGLSSPYIWSTEICDDDAAYAFMGGVWGDNVIDGFLAGLYDTDDAAGILYTDILGDYYLLDAENDNGIWKIEGTITPVEITEIPEGYSISDDPTEDYFDFNDVTYNPDGIGLNASFSSANGASLTNYVVTDGGDFYKAFGVWELRLSGGYDYSGQPGDGWSLGVAGYETDDGPLSVLLEIGAGTSDSVWDSDTGLISASVAGSWIDADEAITGIIGGSLAGTFDAGSYMWQAISMGSLLDTKTFLDMADNNPSALAALDIPCIEVGSVTLSGNGGALSQVTMSDVRFFAYSTDAAPKIWATGDVTGTISAAGSPLESTASLSGSSETASFSDVSFAMDSYDGDGGTWSATVSGSGTVSNYSVSIDGAAAGTVDSSTAFSGTASGVAR